MDLLDEMVEFATKRLCTVALMISMIASVAYGQEGRLQLGDLKKLESRATATVDVDLDEKMLQAATNFLSGEKAGDEAKIKELVAGIKGVYVKSYEFSKEGQYSQEDIDPIRTQLQALPWTRLVNVKETGDHETIEIYAISQGGSISSLAIIAAEPRELTIVNILGDLSLQKLSELGGHLGIPKMALERNSPRK